MGKVHKRVVLVLAVLVVGILALTLRLRAVDQLPIDFDEDDYLRAGLEYTAIIDEGRWSDFTDTNYRSEHPPLQKIIYGVSMLGLSETDLPADLPVDAPPASDLPEEHLNRARSVGAVFGALTAVLAAFVSPLAGIFVAIHTFTIKYTSQVMLEAIPAFFAAASVLAYGRWTKVGGKRWLWWSAGLLGATAASKYNYAIVGLVILAHWFWDHRTERTPIGPWLKQVAFWGGISLFVFVALDPYLWPDPIGRLWSSFTYHGSYAGGSQVEAAGLPFWQPFVWLSGSVPWHPGVFAVSFDLIIGALAAVGLPRLWRENRLLGLWFVIGLGFLLIWPTKWPQYIVTLIVPLAVSASYGARTYLWEPVVAAYRRRRDPGRHRNTLKELVQASPWLLPGIVALVVLLVYPLIFQTAVSLTDFQYRALPDGLNGGVWREVGGGLSGNIEPVEFGVNAALSGGTEAEVSYVGFSLLGDLFEGGGTAPLLGFEIVWTGLSVILTVILGVGFAMMIQRPSVKRKGIWTALLLLPWAVPEFIGALAWQRVVEPRFGWVAYATRDNFPWMERPTPTLLILLIAGVWHGFPLVMLAASAGLRLLPADVDEAAVIDGAGSWRKFRSVTWPLLFPIIAPVVIIRAILSFNQFYLFLVMETDYPMMTFSTLSYVVIRFANQISLSAAINVFTVVVLVVMVVILNNRARRQEEAYG